MTEEATQPRAVEPALLVQRPGILVGLIGAVVALSALAAWPTEYYVFARYAMLTAAGLLALFALLALASTTRGRMNLVWLGAVVIVGAFWLDIFGHYGRQVNMVADVVSAVVFLAAGFFIDRQTKLKLTGVIVCLLIGAAFTWWSVATYLENKRAFQECVADTSLHEGEDPVEWCRAAFSTPED